MAFKTIICTKKYLHYDRKFQIFIFLIGHINVNKGLFCLIISYLQIKSYNVLNYNNSSTDWPFPLKSEFLLCRAFCRHIASCYGFSYYYRCSDIAINSVNPSFKLKNCYNSIHCNFLFVNN
jgi:hypothetical protein